jgi:hypothetical protein
MTKVEARKHPLEKAATKSFASPLSKKERRAIGNTTMETCCFVGTYDNFIAGSRAWVAVETMNTTTILRA